jgi:outer membrane protein TolC
MDAVTAQSEATMRLSEALIAENRALFLQNLERFYTDYVYLGKLQTLLEKEYRLALKTASIAKQRYESGAEDKIAYLRAKNRALAIKSQITSLGEEISQRYFTLLTLAGTQKKICFQKRFIYPLRMPKSQPKKRTPKEAILEAQTKAAEAKLKRSNVLIERYNLYGGIEKEPDQSILRIGLSIPLPLVHQKAEEKQLARLQKEQSQLQLQQYRMERNNTIRSLRASLGALIDAYRENSTLARQQRKLTALLQEGYRLSGARLFDLLMEQQKLIQTEKKRLELQKKINQQQITLRYFEGKYND